MRNESQLPGFTLVAMALLRAHCQRNDHIKPFL